MVYRASDLSRGWVILGVGEVPRVEAHSVERKLAAIFAADVEGYSRLMGQDEIGTLRTLNRYRAIIDPLIASHRGRIFSTAGDSLVADFASAVDAVECAVAVREAIAKENADRSPGEQMRFRIGIHVGDIMVQGDNLFGDAVNIAARLEALAEAGEICVSDAVRNYIGTKLPLAFTDLGSQQVKNIAQPIRAYRIRGDTSRTATPVVGSPLPLPDKPSIAVLPAPTNMSFTSKADASRNPGFPRSRRPRPLTRVGRQMIQTAKARSSPIRSRQAQNSTICCCMPLATALARDVTPSFRNSDSMWNLTVCGEIPNSRAISLLVRPLPRAASTSTSRGATGPAAPPARDRNLEFVQWPRAQSDPLRRRAARHRSEWRRHRRGAGRRTLHRDGRRQRPRTRDRRRPRRRSEPHAARRQAPRADGRTARRGWRGGVAPPRSTPTPQRAGREGLRPPPRPSGWSDTDRHQNGKRLVGADQTQFDLFSDRVRSKVPGQHRRVRDALTADRHENVASVQVRLGSGTVLCHTQDHQAARITRVGLQCFWYEDGLQRQAEPAAFDPSFRKQRVYHPRDRRGGNDQNSRTGSQGRHAQETATGIEHGAALLRGADADV